VIVLLAIICLISYPYFVKLMLDSRKNAFKVSVENIVDSVSVKMVNKEDNFNPVVVTENNLEEMIGVSGENYSNLEFVIDEEKRLYIDVKGKNKWVGLTACGVGGNILVVDTEQCGDGGQIYTDEEITAKIEEGYIPISNADELNNIRFSSNNTFGKGSKWESSYSGGLDKKYIQVATIDMNNTKWNTGEGWVPIGTLPYSCDIDISEQTGEIFSGIYDGAGYKIKNLFIKREISSVPVALFSSSNGSFYNMRLENVDITGGHDISAMPTAALVGQATGNDIVIKNVIITGNIKTVGRYAGNVSAFVGYADDLNKITFANSHFIGNISSDYNFAGGFIGRIINYNEILIENSTVKGNIVSKYNSTAGLIGSAIYDKRVDKDDIDLIYETIDLSNSVVIKNSSFRGEIISQYNKTAGLIGDLKGVDNLIIDGSYAQANIISDYNKTGGLVGELVYVMDIKIHDSHHDGIIFSTYNKTGGLVGEVNRFNNLDVNYSYHIGDITSDYNKTGGLFGEVTWMGNNYDEESVGTKADSVIIKNAYSRGNIRSTYNKTGGIIGTLNEISNVLIDNVHYEGIINGAYTKIAGLVGNVVDVHTLVVKNSNVKGTILGYEGDLGGIIGRIDFVDETNLENNVFEGKIDVTKDQDYSTNRVNYYVNRVGGLVGGIGADSGWDGKPENYEADVYIKNCRVEAELHGKGTRIGGLIGSSDTTYYITDVYNVTIDNSSFIGDIYSDGYSYTIDEGVISNERYYYLLTGGLVGSTNILTINNSYSRGNIFASVSNLATCRREILTNHVVGGLVGRVNNSAKINNSYSAMAITVLDNKNPADASLTTQVKAMAGDPTKTVLNNSYYDSTIAGFGDSLGIAKTTNELRSGIETFNGWDSNIWNFNLNDYPTLK
ncbi:MAG: hypothetical protein PHE05_05155, partial [Bacilli bacterium]|nr:hypothetical protein [Bacilli bacterium]